MDAPRIRMLLLILFVAGLSLILSLGAIPSASRAEETSESDVAAPATPSPSAPLAPTPVTTLSFASNGNGTCTVVGVGESVSSALVIPTHSPVGDLVTAIAPRAFYGLGGIRAVHIPACVEFVGSLAFGACPDLAFVSVSAENASFCALDGVLYSKDLSTLLLYPPMHGGRVLRIGLQTTAIAEMALYRSSYLQSLVYEGSAVDWERISIAPKNYALIAVAKAFEKE